MSKTLFDISGAAGLLFLFACLLAMLLEWTPLLSESFDCAGTVVAHQEKVQVDAVTACHHLAWVKIDGTGRTVLASYDGLPGGIFPYMTRQRIKLRGHRGKITGLETSYSIQ